MQEEKYYNVVFHCMDGESVEVEVPEIEIESFMDSVGKSEVYYNSKKGCGVWIHLDKVRYFEVHKADEQGEGTEAGDRTLSQGNAEDLTARKTGVEQAGRCAQ